MQRVATSGTASRAAPFGAQRAWPRQVIRRPVAARYTQPQMPLAPLDGYLCLVRHGAAIVARPRASSPRCPWSCNLRCTVTMCRRPPRITAPETGRCGSRAASPSLLQGLAHCFEKTEDGKLAPRMVIEPISASSLECMATGGSLAGAIAGAARCDIALL